MHEPVTHVTVQHGEDVLLVVALDDWGGEEEIGVGCGIAPLNVVDLGVSSVPLISKSQDQLSAIVLCSVDDVVQSLEDCLIVDTCELQHKHDHGQCGAQCPSVRTLLSIQDSGASEVQLNFQTCICALT